MQRIFKYNMRKLLANNQGSIAIIGGICIFSAVGAAAIALDGYRAYNAKTALDQVTAFACERGANADMALYPTISSRQDMVNKYATELTSKTALTPSTTTYSVNVDAKSVTVSSASTLNTTLGKVFGVQSLNPKSSKTCAIPLSAKIACDASVKILPAGYVNIITSPPTIVPSPIYGTITSFSNAQIAAISAAINGIQFSGRVWRYANGGLSYIPSNLAGQIGPSLLAAANSYIEPAAIMAASYAYGNTITLGVPGDQLYDTIYTALNAAINSAANNSAPINEAQIAAANLSNSLAAPIRGDFRGAVLGSQSSTLNPVDWVISITGFDGVVIRRSIVSQMSDQQLKDFLQSVGVNNAATLQPFNADGTIPAACVPPPPPPPCVTCECTNTCPPPPCETTNTCPSPPPPSDCTYEGSKPLNYSKHWVGTTYNPQRVASPNAEYISFMNNGGLPDASSLSQSLKLTFAGATDQLIGLWKDPQGVCVSIMSPIVLDLTHKGKIDVTGETTAQHGVRRKLGKTVMFDFAGKGNPVNVEWISGTGQGFLVDNRDGKAETDMNGTRLFGNSLDFSNGYEKLQSLDVKHTGKLSGYILKSLSVWIDNGDAKVQKGELKTLEELGITEISVTPKLVKNEKGETLMQSSAIQNGKNILTEDVWFGVKPK